MKWEADWWGVTIIAESPNGEFSKDMELLTELAKKLTVQTDNYYEEGVITIEDDFEYFNNDSDKSLLEREATRVFKIVFHR